MQCIYETIQNCKSVPYIDNRMTQKSHEILPQNGVARSCMRFITNCMQWSHQTQSHDCLRKIIISPESDCNATIARQLLCNCGAAIVQVQAWSSTRFEMGFILIAF